MKITITARHFDASEKLQEFARSELAHLKRYFEGIMVGEIVLEETGSLKVAEVRLNMLGKTLVASAEGDDFYKVIPKAIDKVEKQVKATKEKAFKK